MNLFDVLSRLTGGQDPNAAIAAQLGGPGATQGQPPGPPPGPQGGLPPSPPPTAPQGAQTPLTNPQPAQQQTSATQSPPDLANMYVQLMQKNQNAQALDSGLTLIAAGLSRYPGSRQALIEGALKGGSGGGTSMTAQDLINLQNAQNAQKNMLIRQAALGGLMKHYNMNPDQIKYLEASGKLDEVIQHYSTENAVQVTHPDGTMTFNNARNGQKIADIPGDPDLKTQIITDANTGEQKLVNTQTGEVIKTLVGKTKPPTTQIVQDANTGEQKLVNTQNGETIQQVVPPRQPGEKVSEDDDKLFQINKDRVAKGQPPMNMEQYLTDVKKSGVQINTGPNNERYPAPPKGQDYERNADGTVKVDPVTHQPKLYTIPGAVQDAKQQALEEKQSRQAIQSAFASSNVGSAIDTAMSLVDKPGVVGLGSKLARAPINPLSHLGGTPQDSFDAAMSTIKGNITLSALNQMRQSSPTGGALGNVSDFEDRMLSGVVAPLDYAQNADQVKSALIRVRAGMELLANHDYTKGKTVDPAAAAQQFQQDLKDRMDELSIQYKNKASKASGTGGDVRRIR